MSNIPTDLLMVMLTVALGQDDQQEINRLAYKLTQRLFPDCSKEEFQERLQGLGYVELEPEKAKRPTLQLVRKVMK